MIESVIPCEGFHDRAFWDGWLTHLGCSSTGFKPGTVGFPSLDPWGDPVKGGQFAFFSPSRHFLRIRPCNGRTNVLPELRLRLSRRATKPIQRLILNVDSDQNVAGGVTGPSGLRQQDVLREIQKIDPHAAINANGEIELDGGKTWVSLARWEANDPDAPGLPKQQTLERVVCAALAAAYPTRAVAVQQWLDSRPSPPANADSKEHAWSHMAGWYAGYGCEAFYSNLWSDPNLLPELENRLRSSGAWQLAVTLAT